MLSKKDKANPLLMESRKLLLNQVDVGEDGRLNAVDEIRTFRYGAAEGGQICSVWMMRQHVSSNHLYSILW